MRNRRFKAEQLETGRQTLGGSEVHHAVNVLRLKAGDMVELFDGRGKVADARILEVSAGQLVVQVESCRVESPASLPLSIAAACPKGDRADWMIEKCAEIGVQAFWPIECDRSQVVPGEGKIERWRRKADQAAKQCGRASVMEIRSCEKLEDVIKHTGSRILFCADLGPQAAALLNALESLESSADRPSLTLFIGPEGGWSDHERAILGRETVKPVNLGDAVLRVETAAVVGAAICLNWAISRAT